MSRSWRSIFSWLEQEERKKPANDRKQRDSAELKKYIRDKREREKGAEKKRQEEAEEQREAIKKRLLALESKPTVVH